MTKEMSQTYSRETQNATGFDGYVGSNWCPNNLDEQIFIEMYNDAVANGKEVKNPPHDNCLKSRFWNQDPGQPLIKFQEFFFSGHS